jgi:hypothetical protein
MAWTTASNSRWWLRSEGEVKRTQAQGVKQEFCFTIESLSNAVDHRHVRMQGIRSNAPSGASDEFLKAMPVPTGFFAPVLQADYGLCLVRQVMAAWMAMLAGPWPDRRGARALGKDTSSIHCKPFLALHAKRRL